MALNPGRSDHITHRVPRFPIATRRNQPGGDASRTIFAVGQFSREEALRLPIARPPLLGTYTDDDPDGQARLALFERLSAGVHGKE
jgi:hypothetical protein